MKIRIDFDGTVTTHDFPKIGKEIGAVPVLKELVAQGHQLILFTMRSDVETPTSLDPDIICESGDFLTQAVNWFKENDIPLFGIQTNPEQHRWTSSPKAYGELIIDDTALGSPLTRKRDGKIYHHRPFINWTMIRLLLIERGILKTFNQKRQRNT